MAQFATNFNEEEIRLHPVTQIPWGTLITVIVPKSKTHEKMLWYINKTHKHGWSRAIVMHQMELKAYERSLIEPTTTETFKTDEMINEVFKDTYVFDFIDKNALKTEKDLKIQMVDNIIRFLHELGPGFALVGKEYKLTTPSDEEFYIDILLYHTKIHAYVVIEVKIGKFHPADVGQLLFYVNAIDDLEKTNRDEPTIGLLLCKDADKHVAQTTLKSTVGRLGISKYKILEELPEYLERRLNEKKYN